MTGWSQAMLSRHLYAVPPADGIQGFDFNAIRPEADFPALSLLTAISAHVQLSGIAINDYWGNGLRIRGVRIHAVANTKTIELTDGSAVQSGGVRARATATFLDGSSTEVDLGFERDIKPLFRDSDVEMMRIFGGFDLHKYEDVREDAEKILHKLKIDMPCDGLWPASDIEKFETWKKGGMLA
jgi:hypothetical protein